jgi:hypothetical protein
LHVPQPEPFEPLPEEPFDDIAKVDIRRSTFGFLHFGQDTELVLLLEKQSSSNSFSHFEQ